MSTIHLTIPSSAAIALAALLFCVATPGAARTLEVGPDKPLKQPSEAAANAQDGDTIMIAPGEYFDCAVWRADNLTIQGTGNPADTVITDKACMGKGLFITVGRNITVRNLTLTRARVPDNNGAGIRMEGKDLTVERVRFINNQNGILTGLRGSSLVVRDSDFVRNGVCTPTCAHGIYAGQLDLLRVEGSRFADTRQAHHIKSRALRTEVVDSDIKDGPEGTASYLIDIPNGGSVLVRGNTMQKGPKAENHTAAIMIGAEGVNQPTREILILNNMFRFEGNYSTVFVVNLTATEAILKGNRIPRSVKPLQGDGEVN
jgi:hypothetical protein